MLYPALYLTFLAAFLFCWSRRDKPESDRPHGDPYLAAAARGDVSSHASLLADERPYDHA